jgi:hypothetical protein
LYFQGCIEENRLQSDSLSNELWYWLSNDFLELKEEAEPDGNCFKMIKFTEKGRHFFTNGHIGSEIQPSTQKVLDQELDAILEEMA